MKNTAFYTDEKTFWHSAGNYVLIVPVGGWVQPSSGPGYAESPESKRRFLNLLDVSGIKDQITIKSAPLATRDELLMVHGAEYLNQLKKISDTGGGQIGNIAPVGPGTYEIAALSAGMAIQALEDVYLGVYDNAYALSRPPGHHAIANESMGFCYFNNLAVAIETVKLRHNLGRVAIIDWDVHHGNGQQEIFEERDDVLTISIHQKNCFPVGSKDSQIYAQGVGKGKGYNINVPLFPGGGNDAYLYAMDSIVIPALRGYKPEVILIACGFDANALDPSARMLLHSESYRAMTKRILEVADELCDGKVVMTHEGGYAESYVPFCGLAVIEAMSGIKTEVKDPLLDFIIEQQPDKVVVDFQKEHIDEWAKLFLKTPSNF